MIYLDGVVVSSLKYELSMRLTALISRGESICWPVRPGEGKWLNYYVTPLWVSCDKNQLNMGVSNHLNVFIITHAEISFRHNELYRMLPYNCFRYQKASCQDIDLF